MEEPVSRQRLMRALLDKYIPNWQDHEDSWMVAESEIENESSEKKELFRMVA